MWYEYLLALVVGAMIGSFLMALLWAKAEAAARDQGDCLHATWHRLDYTETRSYPDGTVLQERSNVACDDCGQRKWVADPDAYTHASGAKADDPDAVVKDSLTVQADGRISK